jgi:putative ABC transport system permease protein
MFRMRFLAFLSLSLKRLRNKPGLTLLLVLAFALTIGLMVCVPVFDDAVSKQILQEEVNLKTKAENCPPFALHFYSMPKYGETMTLEDAAYAQNWLTDLVLRHIGLPIRSLYTQNESPAFYLQPRPGDNRYSREVLGAVRIGIVPNIEQHIRIVQGVPFGSETSPDYLSVWIERKSADSLALQAGDLFNLTIPHLLKNSPLLPVKIAGIWEASDPGDRVFWFDLPSRLMDGLFLTTEAQYRAFIIPLYPEVTGYNAWYYVLDDSGMSFAHAEKYIQGLETIEREVLQRLPAGRMDFSPLRELRQGQQRKLSFLAILFGFSLPLVGVLIYFMASISLMVAQFQRRELAMLSSRGSSRWQVLGLMVLETLLILLLACPVGLAIGLGLARLMGYTQSFLTFVPRPPVQVHLAAIDWRLVALGMAVGALSRLVPSWLATRHSVVTYEQWSARRQVVLSSMRFMLLALLVLATAYAYRQLSLKGSLGLIGLQPDDPSFDPLLLAAPSLFLLTAALIASELFALVTRPLILVGKALPSVAGFLGFMNIGREGGQYRTPVYMIVVCLSLGVFFASLAKSADMWMVDRRRYEVGTDLAFTLETESEGLGAGERGVQHKGLLLPISDYQQIPGVHKAARVAEYAAKATNAQVPILRLMGIDRLDFAQVVYYRRDFSPQSLGELMNRLGTRQDGLLIPRKLAEQLQISEGAEFPLRLRLDRDLEHDFTFTVVGIFDYFPTMYAQDAWMVVANLPYLEMQSGGPLPYGVWMRLEPGANSQEILRAVQRMGLTPVLSGDLRLKLARDQARLERIGLFGMLSISFITGAVLAGVGLLVYSFASMMGQSVRFAVWRALGIKRGEVVAVISLEYLVTLLYGIIAGIAFGIWGARLYVPFFRVTDSTALPVPPFIPLLDWQRAIWMALSMGFVLLLIEAIILVRVVRTRVFEVLRLGVRE